MQITFTIRLFRLFAALTLTAVVVALFAVSVIRDFPVVPHYFFYFTVQGNLMVAMWFALSALFPRLKMDRSAVRGALLLYSFILTAVFWSLLFPRLEERERLVHILTTIIHTWVFAALLIDILATGTSGPISPATPLLWLAYPVFYLVLTMIRGPITGWYPYFFLDPGRNTPVSLTLWMLVLIGVFFFSGYLILLGNRIMLRLKKE